MKAPYGPLTLRRSRRAISLAWRATGFDSRSSDDLADSFYRINAEWSEQMFSLEQNDRDILANPWA